MDRDLSSGIIVFACGMIGLLFAGIEQALYNDGILIDEMITGTISITDIMTVTILLWLIIGTLIAVLRR